MQTKNEFIETLGARKQIMRVEFGNGDLSQTIEMFKRGLAYFVGDDYAFLPEYDNVVGWMKDNHQKGLMLYGVNGRGKSMICKYILPTLFKFYYPSTLVYCTRAFDLSNLRHDNNEYFAMTRSHVIVIDDFGVEGVTNSYGNKYDIFSNIVDIAEHEKKLLICSTNLSPKEIEMRYGLRTLDRLKALTHPVCFNGESMRTRK